MALFFIAGVAGSGKSEVWQELKSRGYEAYNTDESALARWQNKKTGYIYPKSSVKKEQRTVKFLRNHSWNVSYQDVEDLAKRSNGKNVFLCGVADNANELRQLFDAVFALSIDTKTLKNRLSHRTNNDFGKQAHELRRVLLWQHLSVLDYRIHRYIVIDSTRPVKEVVDEILDLAKTSPIK